MGRDPGSRLKDRKAGAPQSRDRVEDSCRLRATGAVLIEPVAEQIEAECVPAASIEMLLGPRHQFAGLEAFHLAQDIVPTGFQTIRELELRGVDEQGLLSVFTR